MIISTYHNNLFFRQWFKSSFKLLNDVTADTILEQMSFQKLYALRLIGININGAVFTDFIESFAKAISDDIETNALKGVIIGRSPKNQHGSQALEEKNLFKRNKYILVDGK